MIGGLASAAAGPGGNRLVADDARRVERRGRGAAARTTCRSGPSCRRAAARSVSRSRSRAPSSNLLYELAGQPAVRRLQDLVLAADEDERELMRQRPAPRRRRRRAPARLRARRLPRAQPARCRSGQRRARGRRPTCEVGQTVQFHVRDAARGRRGPPRCCSTRVTARRRCCSRATAAAPFLRRPRSRRRGRRRPARRRAARRCVLRRARSADRRRATSCTDSPPAWRVFGEEATARGT